MFVPVLWYPARIARGMKDCFLIVFTKWKSTVLTGKMQRRSFVLYIKPVVICTVFVFNGLF